MKEKEKLIKEQIKYESKDKSGKKNKKDRGKGKEFDVMLNYRDRNYEINTLYQAFSNLTKTIKVARDSLYEGDDN